MRTKEEKRGNYRIAFYGHKSIPSREGGIEVVVQEMSVRMANGGHDVTCLNRGGNHTVFENTSEIKDGKYQGVKLRQSRLLIRAGLLQHLPHFLPHGKPPWDLTMLSISMLKALQHSAGFRNCSAKGSLLRFTGLTGSVINGADLPENISTTERKWQLLMQIRSLY